MVLLMKTVKFGENEVVIMGRNVENYGFNCNICIVMVASRVFTSDLFGSWFQ